MTNPRDISSAIDTSQLFARMEMLQAQMEALARDNEKLALENARLTKDIIRIEKEHAAEIDELNLTIKDLLGKLALMYSRHYGSKADYVIPGQIPLFNDMEADVAPQVEEPKLEQVINPTRRRRGGKRTFNFEDMETVVIEHEISLEERSCHECGAELSELKVEVTKVVKLVPAHFIVEEHRRHVYICKPCSDTNAKDGSVPAQIIRAQVPNLPIAGSFASASLIAYILNAKYTNALPIYRIEEDFKCLGAKLSRQTMANWTINVYERWLSLLRERLKEKLLEGEIIHADETRVQVLKEPDRTPQQTSYTWVFCAPACSKPICIYEYHPTRSGSVAAEFLGDWTGVLTTDGYQPYFKLGKNITNTACLVHVKRKYSDIVKSSGGADVLANMRSVAMDAIRYIDEMFAIDAAFDEMEPEERFLARLEKLAPKMDAFEAWAKCEVDKAIPKMELHKALLYTLTYWPYVKNVLSDGRLELSNNIAERNVKPFVIGRKNFLFSNTPRGAKASCGIYSVVITAKQNGLNPRAYLEWLLTEMPNTKGLEKKEVLDRFLPWSDEIPDECKMNPAQAKRAREMKDDPIVDVDPAVFEDKDEVTE